MDLNGIHHVTAVSAQIIQNVRFYTGLLGLRLVKKSVNQDDVSAYHLFYADKLGSPGTDMTFFDWPQIGSNRRGADSISATVFRVNGEPALRYWERRLTEHGVDHYGVERFADRLMLRFEDGEGQRLVLMDDEGAPFEGELWDGADVPVAHALRGFYAVMLSVSRVDAIEPVLTRLLRFTKSECGTWPDGGQVTIYRMDDGGPGKELWVLEAPKEPVAHLGAGGVHHVAFRVAGKEQQAFWRQRISAVGLPVSGFIDRFYFRSIYFRISNGILFEIATDGPGFTADEELESLGTALALPPFLEPRRRQIEAGLKPI